MSAAKPAATTRPMAAMFRGFRYQRGSEASDRFGALLSSSSTDKIVIRGDIGGRSTPDMRQFRDLPTDGYHDAVEQTGSGFAPTFPSDTWFPPVITIDHVLTRNAIASLIMTTDVPGSDHRSLLANIAVPVDPVSTG
jgi:endonuclease/exonuclease/phosphatase (EEP) superfamily protein YafD